MTTKLLCENLIKSYGKTMAVDDVSLRVNSGEIVEFLGPNGHGGENCEPRMDAMSIIIQV